MITFKSMLDFNKQGIMISQKFSKYDGIQILINDSRWVKAEFSWLTVGELQFVHRGQSSESPPFVLRGLVWNWLRISWQGLPAGWNRALPQGNSTNEWTLSYKMRVTLSSIFACSVLVNVHCEILIIYINYLNITVRNKIKLYICFCYQISHNIANVIILLHYICCSSILRM